MEFAVVSNVGSREHNEDTAVGKLRVLRGEECGLFCVADGLGGHGRGEVASALIVQTAEELFDGAETTDDLPARILGESQSRLLALQARLHAQSEMKSTAVLLLVSAGEIVWAHCGDSRLYYFANRRLVCRTLDHSVPQMLVSAGEIKESKIRRHPDRNRLLRVLGTEWEEPQYVVSEPIPRTGADAFLLCSDGFWENITERRMQKALKKASSPQEWLDEMNRIVQRSGAGTDMDNNTAIAVFA